MYKPFYVYSKKKFSAEWLSETRVEYIYIMREKEKHSISKSHPLIMQCLFCGNYKKVLKHDVLTKIAKSPQTCLKRIPIILEIMLFK